MKRLGLAITLLLAALLLCWDRDDSLLRAEETKGAVVDFDGLKSTAPAAWKEEEPASKMRYKQFRLPHVKDDKTDAELLIFRGFGGSAADNIKRWKEQFLPPEGKKMEDVAKVSQMKVAGNDVSYLDVSGVYLFKDRPFDPNAKAEKRPNYRMLAVHFEGPKNIYHIKLVGPEKTVEHYKKGFDDWLKAFK
jgi:hypothetical protein